MDAKPPEQSGDGRAGLDAGVLATEGTRALATHGPEARPGVVTNGHEPQLASRRRRHRKRRRHRAIFHWLRTIEGSRQRRTAIRGQTTPSQVSTVLAAAIDNPISPSRGSSNEARPHVWCSVGTVAGQLRDAAG